MNWLSRSILSLAANRYIQHLTYINSIFIDGNIGCILSIKTDTNEDEQDKGDRYTTAALVYVYYSR